MINNEILGCISGRAALPDHAGSTLLTIKEAPITRARDTKGANGIFLLKRRVSRDEGRSAAPATARRCYNLIVCLLIEIGLGAHAAAAVGDVTDS